MGETTAKAPPLEQALMLLEPGSSGQGLRGNRCDTCKRTYFPKRRYCAECCAPLEGEVILPKTGKLVTFSTSARRPPFALIEPPYTLGEVDLGDGTNIISVIRGKPEEIKVGAPVSLVFEEMDIDGEKRTVYAFEIAKT